MQANCGAFREYYAYNMICQKFQSIKEDGSYLIKLVLLGIKIVTQY